MVEVSTRGLANTAWSRRRRVPFSRGRWWVRLVEEAALSSQLQKLFGRQVPHNQITTHNAGHTAGLAATRTLAAAAVEEDVEGGA